MATISDSKVYEYILFQHDPNRNMMLKALDIVRDYIIENKLVITGGMSIDFALRAKGEKLYDDTTLPDYDFFSPEHHIHAYELGSILCKQLKDHKGETPSISVIDALHITTMKVRVNFIVVADITYMPIDLFNELPTLEHPIPNTTKTIKFRHPHLQMGDQHRALSMPYENAPREVILHRWTKDMKRFDLLYKHYSVNGNAIEQDKYKKINLDSSLLKNACICGSAGLYLLTCPKSVEIELKLLPGTPLVLLSYQSEKLASEIMKVHKNTKVRYFNSYLDVLPQKMTLNCSDDIEIHIYDTTHKLISAETLGDSGVWLANAQFHLLYFTVMQILDKKNAELYRNCYYTLTQLVESGEKPPSHITYGTLNIGPEHILSRAQILSQNKEIPRIKIALKPGRFYPNEETKCNINPALSNFQYEESPLFQVNGDEVEKRPIKLTDFINPIAYDNSSGSDAEN